MNSQPEDELTPALREALAALPREREPGRLLEERTVRALRGAGMLTPPRQIRFPARWMAGAAAACVAIFAGGVVLGQRMAVSASRELMQAQATLMVQQTGTAYAQALASLQQASDTLSPAERQQSREVAVQAFRAAANELVRLAPDDPVAAQVLAGFERARAAQQPRDSVGRTPEVIWY